MPELPEVETSHYTFSKSFIEDPNLLMGQKVLNIERIGKILGIELDSSFCPKFQT